MIKIVVEQFIDILAALGSYMRMNLAVLYVLITNPPRWSLVRDQMLEVGVRSLPVVAITGFSTGMVLAAQSYFQLSDKGMASVTGLMVAKSMMVELGPILTAFMVTGRVGAAMCAELGTMRVSEQVDAIRSMSVDPLSYLIAPRFLAGITMLPLLTIFSCLMGIVGGYVVAVFIYKMSSAVFFEPIPIHVHDFDFISGLFKSFVFAILIVTICCYKGLKTTGGAAGVGRFTTQSVVICYSMILIFNFMLTLLLNSVYTSWGHLFENFL